MKPARFSDSQQGLLYGLIAYGWWGLVPVYFRELADQQVPPLEVLAHRIVWSVLLLVALLAGLHRWADLLRCLRTPQLLWGLLLTTLLVATNWFVYIYGVTVHQIVQTSLGYFITPLVSILLAVVFLRERLRHLQWAAVSLAAGGVTLLTVTAGELPWIALTVAFSFSFYGLLRKMLPVDGLTGLSVETLFLLPLSAGYLIYLGQMGQVALGRNVWLSGLLLLSGVVTAVPLLCFGQAARRLPLTTLSFLQYLSPTLQLLTAVLVFGEEFPPIKQASFACIWAALALFSADSVLTLRRPTTAADGSVRAHGIANR